MTFKFIKNGDKRVYKIQKNVNAIQMQTSADL